MAKTNDAAIFIEVTDIHGDVHLINVTTIARVTNTVGSGVKIQLTATENGNAITVYTNAAYADLKKGLSIY